MDRRKEAAAAFQSPAKPIGNRYVELSQIVFTILLALLLAVVLLLRFSVGASYDPLLEILSAVAVGWLSLGLMRCIYMVRQAKSIPAEVLSLQVFNSSGSAILSLDLTGHILSVNPAAERFLGYNASDLLGTPASDTLLMPDEETRLSSEFERLSPQCPARQAGQDAWSYFLTCLRILPPSQIPSFNALLRHQRGTPLQSTLYLTALRDAYGNLSGIAITAMDQNATIPEKSASSETQERYRDLLDSAPEMAAILNAEGRFLYANQSWKRSFDLEPSALRQLNSWEELFSPGCRSEVTELFRRCMDGESIDRALLHDRTKDGRQRDLELTLNQNRKPGDSLTLHCLLRDVTQQKQREHRLALQLSIAQTASDNASQQQTEAKILEALCISQSWDLAILWRMSAGGQRLEFGASWTASNHQDEDFIRKSMSETLACGKGLPGRAWQEGHTIWFPELAEVPAHPRLAFALKSGMSSGWATPVRADNKVLAVLEFYSHVTLREAREASAALEIAAASLGQLLARSEERGRAEELSRQQEVLLDSVTEGICGLDHRGKISFVNPAAAHLLGEKTEKLTGKTLHELFHGAAPEQHRCDEDCPLRSAIEQKKDSGGEERVFRADGSIFPAEYTLTPILDQGRFSGSVLSFRDISQRFALDRLKDEFISTVSHELRTPLTSIRGALGLLSSGLLGSIDPKAEHLLQIACNNSERLVRLINDILDLERIQSGREPFSFQSVQLNEIVRRAIEDITPMADAAGVQLIHDKVQVELQADPDRLLQVLTNLLSNAVKFSSRNSTVSVLLLPGTDGITLSVIDHGRGIPADKLESIFGRFQQVDASDSRQKGGSGLGLAICRTIVLHHSGRIWAERNPVRGTTFRVFLPYHPKPQEDIEDPFAAESGHGTVLLAGAGAGIRTRVVSLLSRHGYKVIQAETAESALTAARRGVDAILLDTSLDGMNGWQILPKLKQLDPEAQTPVVLLSVAQAQNATEQLPEAEGRVEQPLEEDALLGELSRVLCEPEENARILVVEDDKDLAGIIAAVFSRGNVKVELAYSLKQALEACSHFKPHLLVLDLGLPDGDGFNVVDWLRQHESLTHLPLVVYSGRSLTQDERRQLTLGPTYFLSKTRVQPQQLEALVLTMLRATRRNDGTQATSPATPPE